MADDKSYITEATDWISHNLGPMLSSGYAKAIAPDLATEFSRIASEATRVERERWEALLRDPPEAALWAGVEGWSKASVTTLPHGHARSLAHCRAAWNAAVAALSSIPPQPSAGERGC